MSCFLLGLLDFMAWYPRNLVQELRKVLKEELRRTSTFLAPSKSQTDQSRKIFLEVTWQGFFQQLSCLFASFFRMSTCFFLPAIDNGVVNTIVYVDAHVHENNEERQGLDISSTSAGLSVTHNKCDRLPGMLAVPITS